MPCKVIMDLRPVGAFNLSKNESSATLPCEFMGRSFSADNIANIQVVVSKKAAAGRSVSTLVKELEETIANGGILRVVGQLEQVAYQDRGDGKEHDYLRLFAYHVEASDEVAPDFSMATITGNVGKMTAREESLSASFTISSRPSPGFNRLSFLNIFVSVFGCVVQKVQTKKIRNKRYVTAVGKLAATNTGRLSMTLHDIDYAKFPKPAKQRVAKK